MHSHAVRLPLGALLSPLHYVRHRYKRSNKRSPSPAAVGGPPPLPRCPTDSAYEVWNTASTPSLPHRGGTQPPPSPFRTGVEHSLHPLPSAQIYLVTPTAPSGKAALAPVGMLKALGELSASYAAADETSRRLAQTLAIFHRTPLEKWLRTFGLLLPLYYAIGVYLYATDPAHSALPRRAPPPIALLKLHTVCVGQVTSPLPLPHLPHRYARLEEWSHHV